MLGHKNNLLKSFFSCFVMIHFLGTCIGKKITYCPPSSCGNIVNISHPFRLKNGPKHCGDPGHELTCEDNTTFIYFPSGKYLVRSINYPSHTIRLLDASIIENDSCSFPTHRLGLYNINNITNGFYIIRRDYPYGLNDSVTKQFTTFTCPYRLNNSLLLEVANDCGHTNYMYMKSGHFNQSWMMDNCTIYIMGMVSKLPVLRPGKNGVSLSEIHSSLLYGFELSWFDDTPCGGKCPICSVDGKRATCLCFFYSTCGDMPTWLGKSIDWIQTIVVCVVMLHFALRIIIGIACMLWLLVYMIRRRHLSTFDFIETFLQSNNDLMPIRYSYRDIKKMTSGFRDKLGQGGYGSVYKGKLRSGHIVAVKLLLAKNSRDNGQEFINEIAAIGRIHHVNVVRLIGFYAGRISNKRALVFDFMPNGSLERYIFTRSEENPNPLSWEKKHEIAVGVAKGIEYLHRGCDIQILHFDIKPHNILLDDNFRPKISDFGLARLYATDDNTVTLTAARGTIGYVAPELINRSIGGVSYKADVYSFGMLLMEMVGLNRDIMRDDQESSQYFPYWIYDRFDKGKDIETGDADIEEDNDERAKSIARQMTAVGLWCIQMSPSDRPSMSEVVKMLESPNIGNLPIPPRPSQSNQIVSYSDGTWGTESSTSIALSG